MAPTQQNWPEPMSEAAFHGLAGDFVRLVLPESEADPHALLLTLLIGFGCMVGRGPHYLTENTHQSVNEYLVIVGETAKGRKGTAVDRALHILRLVDQPYMESRVRYGLSTGEGLIYTIRDPRVIGNKQDPGEPDKRLLCIESEFSSVLRRKHTLTEDLRNAWDGKPIYRLVKGNPYGCLRPHISLVANTTTEEVKGLLNSIDRANGFGNRFLWCAARRSELLPEGGGPLDKAKLDALVVGLQFALSVAKDIDRVNFDERAQRIWNTKTYPMLTAGRAGFLGAMGGRAETHVPRIATIYALLDCSSAIRLEHLKAALDVWEYCSDSVEFIFGDAVGNDPDSKLLRYLRAKPEGATTTQINRDVFASNVTSEDMQSTLLALGARLSKA
jgi:hypothetical protein